MIPDYRIYTLNRKQLCVFCIVAAMVLGSCAYLFYNNALISLLLSLIHISFFQRQRSHRIFYRQFFNIWHVRSLCIQAIESIEWTPAAVLWSADAVFRFYLCYRAFPLYFSGFSGADIRLYPAPVSYTHLDVYKRQRHLCELTLPADAVVSKNGIMVASPELLFLQLASKLDIHQIILLGLQLLSHPPGNPSVAITTKQNLNSFLAKTSGHRGHCKALRAVKFLEDGSASVMESLLSLIHI